MLCLKRQFAGLRYGLYITVQLLRVVGDSSVDSELPFCAKGAYRGGPVEYLYPHRSLLAAEISLPRAMPYHGAFYSPTIGQANAFLV